MLLSVSVEFRLKAPFLSFAGCCLQRHHSATAEGEFQWCLHCLWINGHWSSSDYTFQPTIDRWSLSGWHYFYLLDEDIIFTTNLLIKNVYHGFEKSSPNSFVSKNHSVFPGVGVWQGLHYTDIWLLSSTLIKFKLPSHIIHIYEDPLVYPKILFSF